MTDCETLIKYVASYARMLLRFFYLQYYINFNSGPSAGNLTLAPGEIESWDSDTCEIAIVNADTISYTTCYETIVSPSIQFMQTTIHYDPMTSYRYMTLLSR